MSSNNDENILKTKMYIGDLLNGLQRNQLARRGPQVFMPWGQGQINTLANMGHWPGFPNFRDPIFCVLILKIFSFSTTDYFTLLNNQEVKMSQCEHSHLAHL